MISRYSKQSVSWLSFMLTELSYLSVKYQDRQDKGIKNKAVCNH